MVHGQTTVYTVRSGDVNGWIRARVCYTFPGKRLGRLECFRPEAYQFYPILINFLDSLGDRHGENLLFEEGTGGILHVDFNCLFDKVRESCALAIYFLKLTSTGPNFRKTRGGPIPPDSEHDRCLWCLRIQR